MTFSITSGDGNASLNPTSATTGSNGRASTTLTLGNSASGSYTITATVGTKSTSGTATVETTPPPPPSSEHYPWVISSLGSGAPGDTLTLIVEVRGEDENPVPGQTVTFSIASGDGNAWLRTTSATTGSNGRAQTTLTLGNSASGSYNVKASISNHLFATSYATVQTSPPPPELSISVVSGPGSGDPGDSLTFTVEVQEDGSAASGKTVTFSITSGDGNASLGTTSITTGSNGRAQTTLTLGDSASGSYTITATVGSKSTSGTATVEASSPPSPPPLRTLVMSHSPWPLDPGESMTFTVEIQEDGSAAPGQTVTFSVSPDDGTVSLSTTSATTDSNGQAQTILRTGSGSSGSYTVTASVETSAVNTIIEVVEPEISEPQQQQVSPPPPMPTALAILLDDYQTGLPGKALANPFVVEVRDQNGDLLEGVTVTFSVSAGGGSLSHTSVDTDADGLAQTTLTLGSKPGANTVTASAEGISQSTVFNVEASLPPPVATSLSIVSGGNQTGLTGEALVNPFVIDVRDQYDDPMAGVTVTFAVSEGGGSLSHTSIDTDADGLAQTTLTLGSKPGANTVTASAEGISQSTVFNVEASLPPPVATSLSIVSGGNQTGLTGEALVNPFVIEVRDQYDDPMAGVTVTFAVSEGGGSLSHTSIDTDADGLAQTTLTLGSKPGTNTVEASAEGISQSTVFSAEASLPLPIPTRLLSVSGSNQSGITGEALVNPFVIDVRDQYDDPMAGVTVTFAVSEGGGSLSHTSIDTDADGLAQTTLTLGSKPGANTVTASAEGISQSTVFNVEASLPPPVATSLSIVSGGNQTGLTGEALVNPFVIEVRDQYDDPMAGVTVTFAVSEGGGSLSHTSIDTDADGLAQTTLTLGSKPGTNTVEASAEGISQSTVFSAEASLPLPIPTRLLSVSGSNQSGITGEALVNPFVIEVRDQYDDPMAGVTVTFAVSEGGGSLSAATATTDANGRAESTLTLGSGTGTNTVEVSVEGITEAAIFNAVAELLQFDLTVPSGTSLIHVPLKVRTVDGAARTIESIADLYDALGGADTVKLLITYNRVTHQWNSYLGDESSGGAADMVLTDDLGIIASLKMPVTVRIGGDEFGSDGMSTIRLIQGKNLVGLPLNDSRITRVSDLLTLEGFVDNAPAVTVSDNGTLKPVEKAEDDGDISVTGGQAFIIDVLEDAIVTISGEGWDNTSSGTMAAPPLATGDMKAAATTPVLALSGSIVDGVKGINGKILRVIVKNLSTGRAVNTLIGDTRGTSSRAAYELTVVDIEGGRAAAIGDILEISAISPDAFISVDPFRYTVTAEDVKRHRIQLSALIVQEIPTKTQLLPNYPNPFNPETWIPYHLTSDAEVQLTIYDTKGVSVRQLDLGHQVAGYYTNQTKAAYWDGRNENGESVASGVYFYQLQAGGVSATRKMVILK